ncbi:tripartite tricarboxylate transporter substrate binding protein, partial [Priestia flexa]|nr:tripartite tricarboxylate transporter substrate binding protein [Priestia flexa]
NSTYIDYYQKIFKKASDSKSFAKVRESYGWDEQYMDSEEFKLFLDEQSKELETLLKELGFIKK